MWYQFPSASTLHLASLELHGIVVLCKLSIVWTLIGTICIQVFNRRIRDTFTVFHSLLKEMAVCKYCSFNLNGSDDVRLAFLYSLCDVGHIALHLLVVLGTIGCIRIVRILKTVCLYLLLVSKYSLSVHYDILFIKQTLKKIMCRRSSRKSCQHLHDEITNSGKIALKRIRVRAINCLGGILFQVFLCPFFLLWGEMGKRACLEELDQSCMYQFIARLASDIAADKLTVHTDAFA